MATKRLRGYVVKYSADEGIGFIKPVLKHATTVCCGGGNVLHVEPTDRIIFYSRDVCSETERGHTAMVPVVPVGGIVLFALHGRKSSARGFTSGADVVFSATNVTMDEVSSQISLQYLTESEWMAWRAERKWMDNMLQDRAWRDSFVFDEATLSSACGIPIDF
ncbi:hypothetical protein DQ04_00621150 [Trypanosoma grayi]|uniref:hypothetical protein n=1 Tax=Trypanosoma grayi TaxID=71804 RepID=UPI0004F476D8|nr:hypothetical protein DQ04_00621150 [Trypanosoma grayi]KEG14106.1 hypothetical protein DQ04_00621150 [Trypanosoma grayi]